MRILHIVPYFAPAWAFGGTPRAVYEIAKRQVDLGHQVTVLTTTAYLQNKMLGKGKDNIDGVEIIRVENWSNKLLWYFRFPLPKEIPIDPESFEIIHLHETRTLLNYLVLKKVRTQKVLFSPWGTLPYNNQHITIKKIFDKLFLKKFSDKVSLSLGQNEHETQELLRFGFKKVKLLPLGIDLKYFDKLPSKKESRQKLNLPEEVKIFLFLGRFSKAKGIDLLLYSFKEFLKKGKAKLLIVGRDDGFLNQMKTIIRDLDLKEDVIISDPLYEKDRLLAYIASDGLVFTPTVYEETSTACLEALACNRAVVTTYQSEIPFLGVGEGVIHTKLNKTDISKAMSTIDAQKVNIKELKKHFDWDMIVKSLSEFIMEAK